MSERTFRRWRHRFEEAGEAGLLDRRLGRPPPKRMPPDGEAEIGRLYRTRYKGFAAARFHGHLTRDRPHRWSHTRVKQLLQAKGLPEKALNRGAHRREWPRRPLRDMMPRKNGSRHAWLDGQAPLDLIVTMDDATGEIDPAFRTQEEGADPASQIGSGKWSRQSHQEMSAVDTASPTDKTAGSGHMMRHLNRTS